MSSMNVEQAKSPTDIEKTTIYVDPSFGQHITINIYNYYNHYNDNYNNKYENSDYNALPNNNSAHVTDKIYNISRTKKNNVQNKPQMKLTQPVSMNIAELPQPQPQPQPQSQSQNYVDDKHISHSGKQEAPDEDKDISDEIDIIEDNEACDKYDDNESSDSEIEKPRPKLTKKVIKRQVDPIVKQQEPPQKFTKVKYDELIDDESYRRLIKLAFQHKKTILIKGETSNYEIIFHIPNAETICTFRKTGISCSCPSYQHKTNALGYCKHISAILEIL